MIATGIRFLGLFISFVFRQIFPNCIRAPQFTTLLSKQVAFQSNKYTFSGIITPIAGFYEMEHNFLVSSIVSMSIIIAATIIILIWYFAYKRPRIRSKQEDSNTERPLFTEIESLY